MAKPFKKGNKEGTKNKGKKFNVVTDFRKLLRETVDYSELASILMRLARGGENQKNGNGVEFVSIPDINAVKILLEYGYGKPAQQTEIDTDTKNTLSTFNSFIADFNKPITVSNTGKLETVSTNQSTITVEHDETVLV